MSGASAFGSASCGTFSSSTMIVMMTAITPSLKASSRPLVTRRSSRHGQRPSQVILLSLVPYGQNAYRASGLDFKQRHIARGAEGNDEFPQKWIFGERLAAGERRETQQLGRSFDRFQNAPCPGHGLFQQQGVETNTH